MLSKEEIEKAKERLAVQAVTSKADCEDYPNCICMKKDLIIALNYIEQLEQENNKQNKMIDEMASYISNLDVDENICKKVKISPCADETAVPVSYCIECIKQYFEKKVEGK